MQSEFDDWYDRRPLVNREGLRAQDMAILHYLDQISTRSKALLEFDGVWISHCAGGEFVASQSPAPPDLARQAASHRNIL